MNLKDENIIEIADELSTEYEMESAIHVTRLLNQSTVKCQRLPKKSLMRWKTLLKLPNSLIFQIMII